MVITGLVYRMNSAILCLIRQYLLGNDVSLGNGGGPTL
jgi:hypothetical protein